MLRRPFESTLVARTLGGAELGIQLVPKAEVALVLALAETSAAAGQTVGFGLGVALRLAPDAVLFLEPTAALAFTEGESEAVFGGTFGLGFSF